MLVRLLYASRANTEIDESILGSILGRSHKNNLEHGITGILCTYPRGNLFLQALEGGRTAVNELYGNIVRDPRHRDITLLHYSEINERRFSSWQMGSVNLERVNLGSILRFSEKPILDPFSMTSEGALTLLEELASAAAIVSRDGA